LTWKDTTAELHAQVDSKELTAHFPFVNSGSAPVDIVKITTSCGCTVASTQTMHIAPGQSGEVTAVYEVANHAGQQKKTVAVTTSDQPAPTILTLVIQIPELLRIQPEFVIWQHNEDKSPKILTVDVLPDTSLDALTVRSSNPALAVELTPVIPGRQYQIRVTPARTDEGEFATLTIHAQAGDRQKTFRTYANVRPAPAEDQ
jgi:hypothetical protein